MKRVGSFRACCVYRGRQRPAPGYGKWDYEPMPEVEIDLGDKFHAGE